MAKTYSPQEWRQRLNALRSSAVPVPSAKPTAAEAFDAHRAQLLAKIEILRVAVTGYTAARINWAHVGDLEAVEEQVDAALALVSDEEE